MNLVYFWAVLNDYEYFWIVIKNCWKIKHSQLPFTCSNSAIETLGKGKKHVQS